MVLILAVKTRDALGPKAPREFWHLLGQQALVLQGLEQASLDKNRWDLGWQLTLIEQPLPRTATFDPAANRDLDRLSAIAPVVAADASPPALTTRLSGTRGDDGTTGDDGEAAGSVNGEADDEASKKQPGADGARNPARALPAS